MRDALTTPSMDAPSHTSLHTLALHAGQSVEARTLPAPPLVLNSAVPLTSIEEGWEMLTHEALPNIAYQRYGNPTVAVLEDKFARLEGATHALAVNSGMTACFLTFRALLNSGDHVVSQHSLYHEISDQLIADRVGCNVDVSFVTNYSTASFDAALRPNTKMVFIESPTNPVMLDVDLAKLAQLCRSKGIILVVDNTLLTPLGQRPLELGADIALYSTTKSINGHGDAMGGIITTNCPDIFKKLRNLKENTGLGLDPLSAYLTLRGLRTLPLRLKHHTENSGKVVKFLQEEFPHLPTMSPRSTAHYAENKIAEPGGIVSIKFPEKEMGTDFVRGLELFKLATTFGNLESLVYHFGTFTRPHRNLDTIGLPYGLVRLSVGLEDVADITQDLRRAITPVFRKIYPVTMLANV